MTQHKIPITKNEQMIALVLEGLHEKWAPHKAQAFIIRSMFEHKKKRIFIECGRKFGKDEVISYILWRFALSAKNLSCYYFAPFQKQAKEILWANGRIKNFGPQNFLRGKPNDTEMRLTFRNNSFIKLDGSDNYNAYRGITPDIVVYNEFKDFRPECHSALDPNLAAKNAPLIIAGTPPETETLFDSIADEVKSSEDGAYFNFPSWANPHLDREWLKKEKDRLYKRGEGSIWEREYEAKRVRGGPNAIFPMWSRNLVRLHEDILQEIRHDMKKLVWIVAADPGTVSVFAMMFMAVNPYKKKAYFLDELYLTSQDDTSTSKVVPRLRAIKAELFEGCEEWTQVCDEAAAWFMNEAWQSYEEHFIPTLKAANKKDAGLSLMKDLMLENRFIVSERCVKFIWEMENYVKDKNGNIPKINDHQIDNARYGLSAAGFNLMEEKEPEPAASSIDREPRERIGLMADLEETGDIFEGM